MGAWSARIFDDDVAMDIIGEYKILLGYGIPPEEVYEKISDYFSEYQKGDTDVYWLAIALYQWQNGILMEEVKQKALECIDNETYLERWKDSGEKIYKRRKHVLEELRYNLINIVNPVKKKFPKCPRYYRYKTKWKTGDLLSYKMTEPMIKWGELVGEEDKTKFLDLQKKIKEGYLLLRVIKISKTPVSDICPELDYSSSAVVMLYDWIGNVIPSDEEIKCMNFKPIINYYTDIRKTMVSSVCLEENYIQKEKEWCDILLLSTEENFELPKMYIDHPVSPFTDIRQFGTTLIHTFALAESDEAEWYSAPDWLNDCNDW